MKSEDGDSSASIEGSDESVTEGSVVPSVKGESEVSAAEGDWYECVANAGEYSASAACLSGEV